jgi:hypothetical protein
MQKKPLPSSAGSRSVAEARFGADKDVKEPGSVREVGVHVWVRWAEEREVDEPGCSVAESGVVRLIRVAAEM